MGQQLLIELDPSVRRIDDGRVLLGGSPRRLLTLSDAARATLDQQDWGSPTGRALATRLMAAGFAHPRPQDGPTLSEVSVVIPVRDRAAPVRRLLAGLDPQLEVIVVDDGSATPLPEAAVRHPTPRGPAAARNAGIARTTRPFIALVDSDVVAPTGWLQQLLPHFTDPQLAAVAPRIVVAHGAASGRIGRLLARYDTVRSPLDLGDRPGPVVPGSRLAYLPAAALVLRRAALGAQREVFDEELRFGEDVDLIWRLVVAGWTVRYEPAAVVGHAARPTLRTAAAQRFGYGCSAAPLAKRHPGKLAPFAGNRWTLAAYALLAGGHPLPAVATLGVAAARLSRKLPVKRPLPLASQLVAQGSLAGGRALAEALTRPYGPLALPLLLAPGPGTSMRRRIAVAALLLPAAAEYARRRPDLDPLRWLALRICDDLAYGTGVWVGCLRERTLEPLHPAIS